MLVNRTPLVLGIALVAVVLFYLLHPILTPFALGGLLAYLGDPLVDRLEARGYSRTGGVLLVFLMLTLLLILALLVLVPVLLAQLDALVRAIPEVYRWLSREALPWIQTQLSLSPVQLPVIDWETELATHWKSLGKLTASTLIGITNSGASFLLGVFNLALVPVVAFYLLRDWDRMMEALLDLVPLAWQENLSLMVGEADDVLGAFLKGQFLVMLVQAFMYSAGLWLIGLDFALLLGLVAGLASIIPYAGSVIGVGSSLIAAWVQHGGELVPLLWVGGVFAFGQMVESYVLTPMLIGDRIGLHPVAVIFALMAGGQLAGFTGVLLALPVAAVLLVFLRHALSYYRDSDAYKRD